MSNSIIKLKDYIMSNKQQPQVEQSVFGALTGTVKRACSVLDNGLAMVDNAFVAGERITYIAASKASNLAEISDTADTLKLLIAKKQLQDEMVRLEVKVDENGNMSF